MRSAKEPVQVGRELAAVLGVRCAIAPSLAGPVVGADTGRGRDRSLHLCPARCALSQPVEEDDRWRALADTVQVQAVPIDEVGATAKRRV